MAQGKLAGRGHLTVWRGEMARRLSSVATPSRATPGALSLEPITRDFTRRMLDADFRLAPSQLVPSH